MLRRAALRARSLQTHVERASTSRAIASSAASSQKSDDEDSMRKAAEARAASKVYAGSSPLFSWTEVDVSDADKHIPRWQNAVFVVVVGSFLAWFGNKLVTSELQRREKVEKERAALERRARGDLMDARLPIGYDLQQDELGNYVFNESYPRRRLLGPARVVSPFYENFNVDGAVPSEEFLAPRIEAAEFAPATVRVLAGAEREPELERKPEREPSRAEMTLRLPRALARWTCAQAWNQGILTLADASIEVPEAKTEAAKDDDAGRSSGPRRSRRLSSR